MNRYDWSFRALPALIRANASQKVGFARAAIVQHRGNGFGPEDDDAIVHQFDLAGMQEFWDVVLSEPMSCEDFAHALAIHFMAIEHKPGGTDADRLASGPAACRAVDIVKAGLRAALRQARNDGEPWFIEMPEPSSTKLDAKSWLGFVPSDTVIVPAEPPADGVDLLKLKVRPRAAVEWLIAMPRRRHLVPASLAFTLQPPIPAVVEAGPTKPAEAQVPARRRGPKPAKLAAVTAAIKTALFAGKHTPQTLDEATEESLVAEFSASRETCRKARNLVLSEFVGDRFSGK